VQLVINILPAQRHIRDVLAERSIVASQFLTDQWRQLVLGPLLKLEKPDDEGLVKLNEMWKKKHERMVKIHVYYPLIHCSAFIGPHANIE
jgi:hypothetical protein